MEGILYQREEGRRRQMQRAPVQFALCAAAGVDPLGGAGERHVEQAAFLFQKILRACVFRSLSREDLPAQGQQAVFQTGQEDRAVN